MKNGFLKEILKGGIILTALCLTGCSKTVKINLNDYVIVSYSGYDGYGEVTAKLDYSSMREDYGDKLSLSSTALYWGYTSFSEIVDEMEELEYGVSVSPNSELSNGDIVTISLDELADDIQLFTEDDIDINFTNKVYTVSGLEELSEKDVFDNVSVTFTGIAPGVKAELSTSGDLSNDYFEMSQTSDLNIGDAVTVTIKEKYIEDIIEMMGYKPIVTSKDYIVEGINYYIPSLAELPDTASAKMEEQAKSVFDSIVAGWNDPNSLKSYDLLGYYFLYDEELSGYSGNEIVLVYEYHVNQMGEDVTAYWYCKFTDGVVMTDGTFSMDYSNYSAPTGGWWDFGSPSFEYTSNDGTTLNYPGYSDLDTMYYQLITSNLLYYSTYESTVTQTSELLDNSNAEEGFEEEVFVLGEEETNGIEDSSALSRIEQYCLEELLELKVVDSIPYIEMDSYADYETGVFCIAEIPEEDIRMYIYYDEDIGFQGVAFSIGEEAYYFDWCYTCSITYLPELFWDGENQRVLVKCYKNRGTGCAVQELYILQKNENGTWISSAYKYEEYTEALYERITLDINAQNQEYTITDNATGEILDQNIVTSDVPSYDFWKFDIEDKVIFAANIGCYMGEKLNVGYYYFAEMKTLCFEIYLVQNADGSITFEIGKFLGYE